MLALHRLDHRLAEIDAEDVSALPQRVDLAREGYNNGAPTIWVFEWTAKLD